MLRKTLLRSAAVAVLCATAVTPTAVAQAAPSAPPVSPSAAARAAAPAPGQSGAGAGAKSATGTSSFLYDPVCTTTGAVPTLTSHSGVQLWLFSPGTYMYENTSCAIGKSSLLMQSDGNFVLYDETWRARWAIGPKGAGAYMKFQVDGNLVVYDWLSKPAWASNTCCHDNQYRFAIQADGNLVIYDTNWGVHWASGTNH